MRKNKISTKFILISLCILLLSWILAMIQTSKTATYEDLFEYELKSGTAVISKYIGTKEAIAIPDIIAGAMRISVQTGAFKDSTLKKIVMLNNVKNIEKGAFTENSKTVIYGKDGSVAQRYAQENNMEFRIYCDINGDEKITATDLLQIKKHIVEINDQMLNEDEQIRADINCDEKVTTTDLLTIKKVIVGIDETGETEEPEEPEVPEEHEGPSEEIATPTPTEEPEQYVTLTYVTNPSEYPSYTEKEPWVERLNKVKADAIGYQGRLRKDISTKEVKVLKGDTVTITSEEPLSVSGRAPIVVRHQVAQADPNWPCHNDVFMTITTTFDFKFRGSWIANKNIDIIDTSNGSGKVNDDLNKHKLLPRMENKSK